MTTPFFFVFVAKEDNVFGETHHVEGTEIYGFNLTQSEHEQAGLEIEIANPYESLLSDDREQWGWLSWKRPDGVVIALFFGRIIGVPQNIEDETIRVQLIARPEDYEEQRSALAEELRVLPWWDPLWFSPEEREEPNSVLEARAMLWDVDRLTHVLSATSITFGEDGTLVFGEDDVFYDSVDITHNQHPKRIAIVNASVNWDQVGAGELDITPLLIEAFGQKQPSKVKKIDDTELTTEGMIVLTCGQEMIDKWPEEGKNIGGGWEVGESIIGPIGLEPTIAIFATQQEFGLIDRKITQGNPFGGLWGRTPGLKVKIDRINTDENFLHNWDILWVPMWRLAATLKVRWSAARARNEDISFQINADVQPLRSVPGEDEILRLDFGPFAVDDDIDDDDESTESTGTESTEAAKVKPIRDVRRPSFFNLERGRQSFEHLVLRTRAELLAAARCVEVSWEAEFGKVVEASCRKNATITDYRIPGGTATGKIKHYFLSFDGNEMLGGITIGCTIGRGGEVEALPGDPVYAEAGYMKTGYQAMDGQVYALPSADISYQDYGLQEIDDDGKNLFSVNALDYVKSLTVEGGITTEQEEVTKYVVSPDFRRVTTHVNIIDKISGVKTKVRLEMEPTTGGPFKTQIIPAVSDFLVPKTIDLE